MLKKWINIPLHTRKEVWDQMDVDVAHCGRTSVHQD